MKEDGEPPAMWVRDKWRHLLGDIPHISAEDVQRKVAQADRIEAHNAEFETAIWEGVLRKRHGWPPLPLDKLSCSAAKAAACSLPRALEGACAALALPIRKDFEGYVTMLRLCKPRKPSQHNETVWIEDAEMLTRLFRYCANDANAEYALSEALPDLSDAERVVWLLDQTINRRGVQVDLVNVQRMIAVVQAHSRKLLAEFQTLTGDPDFSPTQIEKLRTHLAERHNFELSDLTKNTVAEVLKNPDINPTVRRLLEIRQAVGKTSVAKYYSLLNGANADGRIRSLLMYHAAATGRWGGRRFQPQNLPREGIDDYELLFAVLEQPDIDAATNTVEVLWRDPIAVASRALRNMIVAAPGKTLYVGDFKSIEALVTAWLAGQTDILDAFIKGLDLYVVAAQDIAGKPYDAISKAERQLGKVAVLALGFGGSVGAFTTMSATYDLPPMERKDVKAIVARWREANHEIVRLWKQLEAAALFAVQNPGSVTEYNGVKFIVQNGFLNLLLPSKRVLRYASPRIETKLVEAENDDGTTYTFETQGICYDGVDSTTNQWCKQDTYGGKLTENIVQATARDLLAYGMLNAERAGYRVVLSVHDEIVSETVANFGSVGEFNSLITRIPVWATGLPLQADCWKGNRYRK